MVTQPAVKFPLPQFLLATALATALRAQPAAAPETMIAGTPLSEIAQSKIEVPAETHWIGELFPLTHRVSIAHANYSSVTADFDWSPDDLIFEEWSAPIHSTVENIDVVTQTTRGYAKTAGSVRLPNTKQAVTLITSTTGDRTQLTDKFTITTSASLLRVRELPEPAPSAFSGAVGDFTLESRITSSEVAVGDSVTWTLELRGTGNWPEITRVPSRVVSKDFQGVAPILKRAFKAGALFEGSLTEDVMLVPTKAGSYQLGPVRFVYFDPKEGKYQLVTTETFTLNVGQRAGGAKAVVEQQGSTTTTSREVRTPVPAAPPLLPLDPLPESWWGSRPLPPALLNNSLLISLGALVLYWLLLAFQRSELTDPLHSRRQARTQVVATLRALEHPGLSAEETRRLIFAWEKNTAALAGVKAAMPIAVKIARALEGEKYRAASSTWAGLWREANQALYGEFLLLPTDWVLRAKAALAEIKIRHVPFRALFFRHNLLPFAAMLALCLVPLTLRADPLDDYRKGDFVAAEKAWRIASAATPLDAHARYNLALVAAQQNHWSESVAHSLAAFCLEPRNPSIRWQFALSLERAGIENAAFSPFVTGGMKYQIARTFSPSEWGLIGSGSAFAAAIAAGTLLYGFYRHRSRRFRWTTGVVTIATGFTVLAAVVSLRCYGPLAETSIAVVSRNALLCSVPTEIDSTQKTVPLPAGSLARVDRTFLGWSRLVFPNGQTGWVRTDWVTSLYE